MFLGEGADPAFQRAGAQGSSPGGPDTLDPAQAWADLSGWWGGGRTGHSSIPSLLWWGRPDTEHRGQEGRRACKSRTCLRQLTPRLAQGTDCSKLKAGEAPGQHSRSSHTALQPLWPHLASCCDGWLLRSPSPRWLEGSFGNSISRMLSARLKIQVGSRSSLPELLQPLAEQHH